MENIPNRILNKPKKGQVTDKLKNTTKIWKTKLKYQEWTHGYGIETSEAIGSKSILSQSQFFLLKG